MRFHKSLVINYGLACFCVRMCVSIVSIQYEVIMRKNSTSFYPAQTMCGWNAFDVCYFSQACLGWETHLAPMHTIYPIFTHSDASVVAVNFQHVTYFKCFWHLPISISYLNQHLAKEKGGSWREFFNIKNGRQL